MNYYDELIENIEKLIEAKDYEHAKLLIDEELSLPYVPKEYEDKLNTYLLLVDQNTTTGKTITDEEIEEFLYKDETYQLIAIDSLDKKNLRDYIDIVYKYLSSNGFINAKALLIDSLIKQEINYEFSIVNNDIETKFNPSKMSRVEESEGFLACIEILDNHYMKEPSKYMMASQLLYKQALLSLPSYIEIKEANKICTKIIEYIEQSFDSVANEC